MVTARNGYFNMASPVQRCFFLVKYQDTNKENVSHYSTHRNKQATDNSTVPLKLQSTGTCLNMKTLRGRKKQDHTVDSF